MSCARTLSSRKVIKRIRPALGTYVRIIGVTSVEGHDRSINAAFKYLNELEIIFSKFHPDSELSAYRRDQRICGPHFQTLLAQAQEMESLSEGAFRVFDESGQVDLTGIAKGYIVDRLAELIVQSVPDFEGFINAGGDGRWVGRPAPYTHGVQVYNRGVCEIQSHLPAVASSSLAISIEDSSSTTKYFLPRAEGVGVQDTVSVMAKEVCMADALTKVVLFSNSSSAARLLRRFEAQAIHFDKNGRVLKKFT